METKFETAVSCVGLASPVVDLENIPRARALKKEKVAHHQHHHQESTHKV